MRKLSPAAQERMERVHRELGQQIKEQLHANLTDINLCDVRANVKVSYKLFRAAVATFTDLQPVDYLQHIRKEYMVELIKEHGKDIQTVTRMFKFSDPSSLRNSVLRWFGISFTQLVHLIEINRLEKFEAQSSRYYEFVFNEMVEFIEKNNGRVSVDPDLFNEFKIGSYLIYFIWNKNNPNETILDYCQMTQLQWIRNNFKENPCTMGELLKRTGYKRSFIDKIHKNFYGKTLNRWVKEHTNAPKFRHPDGGYTLADPKYLDRVRDAIKTESDTLEEVSKRSDISIGKLRRIITGFTGMNFGEFKRAVLNPPKEEFSTEASYV
ncbi:hypothetical protein [Vibrio phage phiKT1028]|nr:hypothetical protein [Vibrio phage phiKT1028]